MVERKRSKQGPVRSFRQLLDLSEPMPTVQRKMLPTQLQALHCRGLGRSPLQGQAFVHAAATAAGKGAAGLPGGGRCPREAAPLLLQTSQMTLPLPLLQEKRGSGSGHSGRCHSSTMCVGPTMPRKDFKGHRTSTGFLSEVRGLKMQACVGASSLRNG